ncbi:MAG TPA: ATP-binding protein [Vicinamibacterales bacterium]|jgi:signal transduction histidine kinase
MTDTTAKVVTVNRQSRPTVATLLVPLRVRLPLLVALVVTVVVGASGYLELRVFESSIRSDLIEIARSTAQAVADDVEIGEEPTRREDLAESLREFTYAFPSIRAISVISVENSEPTLVASTSSAEGSEALSLARQVAKRDDVVHSELRAQIHLVGVPTKRNDRVWGAVVATYSFAAVEELRRQGRIVVVWFVPAAIILVTLVLDLLTRRLIHKPIAGIRKTMQRVSAGDLGARAPVARPDEIGVVADGLNEMLAQMEGFNEALQERVREATSELRAKNEELVESYQRVFSLREALARADQLAAVGHMAANVAHQVGTPLNLISGYVQMIREEEGRDSRVTRRLEIVQEQIAKVTTIVRTMLDHARRPIPKELTDIGQLARRVSAVARPKLDALGVKLDLSVSTVPPVMADAVQLELALLNLVTNSLDAMPAGGVTSMTVAATEQGAVRIQVADTGTGIAPELLPRIFDPWVTTKEAGRGTGLGLSITREVVAGHGGTISVKSDVGVGSVFTIELPAATLEG